MASMDTSTPTAHVTPMMMVLTSPRRAGMPARFIRSKAENCRTGFISSPQRIGDRKPRSSHGRRGGADQRHEHRSDQSESHDDQRHGKSGYHLAGVGEYAGRRGESDDPRGYADEQAF